MEPAEFSKAELERYSRQILLYGREGQAKLKSARVIVIGAGGLGATVLPLLAASGVGEIEIWDSDRVEQTNLGRQLIYREGDLGKYKAECAKSFLYALNPHIRVHAHAKKFTAGDAAEFSDATLIFEGSDSLKTKFLVNDLAIRFARPAVISALGNAQGHTMLVYGAENACYRCVFDEIDERELPTCAGEGILSAFPAVVGAQAAHAGIGFILGVAREPGFWVFEKSHCRRVNVKKRTNCQHTPL